MKLKNQTIINIDRIMNRICLEIVKAVFLIAMGYAWAVKAYGVLR